MQRKTLIALAAVLTGACALPAFAQDTPAHTNLDPAAAHKETRNARGSQLTDVTPEQARANQLRRCDNLSPFYKTDCVARINGQGSQAQGSVEGGGILTETRTTISEAEYKKLKAESGSMGMRPTDTQDSQAQPAEHQPRKHRAHRKAKKPAQQP